VNANTLTKTDGSDKTSYVYITRSYKGTVSHNELEYTRQQQPRGEINISALANFLSLQRKTTETALQTAIFF
jgi:hypothetical protein